jgi:hypothetical protein
LSPFPAQKKRGTEPRFFFAPLLFYSTVTDFARLRGLCLRPGCALNSLRG